MVAERELGKQEMTKNSRTCIARLVSVFLEYLQVLISQHFFHPSYCKGKKYLELQKREIFRIYYRESVEIGNFAGISFSVLQNYMIC